VSPQASPETVRRILDPRTPRAEAEQLLQSLSDAEKTDLILRVAETAHRKTLIVDIANRVSDSLSLDVLFPRLMEVVTETLNADRSSLFLHDPETGELFSRVMQGSVMGEVRFSATLGIAGSVFASGKGEIIADAYADSRFNRDMDRRTGYRTRNILCVPIRNRKHEVIGITQALNKRGGDFDTEDEQLLEALSHQAASALENARIFEKVERAQREEALLLEVVSSIASEIYLEPLLQKIIDAATLLLEADRGSLFLYDPAKSELYSRVAGGATIKEIRFPSNAGIAGECFTAGAPINIEIAGDNFAVLGEIAKQVKDVLVQQPHVEDVRDDFVEGIPSVQVLVDRQKAALFGLSTDLIGFALKSAYNGLEVSTYREGDDDYDITVQLAESDRRVVDILHELMLPTPSGQMVAKIQIV